MKTNAIIRGMKEEKGSETPSLFLLRGQKKVEGMEDLRALND